MNLPVLQIELYSTLPPLRPVGTLMVWHRHTAETDDYESKALQYPYYQIFLVEENVMMKQRTFEEVLK
jgi:hypothetical protein